MLLPTLRSLRALEVFRYFKLVLTCSPEASYFMFFSHSVHKIELPKARAKVRRLRGIVIFWEP
jgi:hypothetical protein